MLLNRVRDVLEMVRDAELPGQQLAETPHTENLGGVVPTREEMDRAVLGRAVGALCRFTCHERVAAGGERVAQVIGSGARDDADLGNAMVTTVDHQWRTAAKFG